MTTFTTQDRQDAERATLGNELIQLVKSHIRHSLCGGPISIQSRVYLDDVEISSLRQEKPNSKPLKNDDVLLIWAAHQGGGAIEFARAIERAHGIGE